MGRYGNQHSEFFREAFKGKINSLGIDLPLYKTEIKEMFKGNRYKLKPNDIFDNDVKFLLFVNWMENITKFYVVYKKSIKVNNKNFKLRSISHHFVKINAIFSSKDIIEVEKFLIENLQINKV